MDNKRILLLLLLSVPPAFCDTGGDEERKDNASVSNSTDVAGAWTTRVRTLGS